MQVQPKYRGLFSSSDEEEVVVPGGEFYVKLKFVASNSRSAPVRFSWIDREFEDWFGSIVEKREHSQTVNFLRYVLAEPSEKNYKDFLETSGSFFTTSAEIHASKWERLNNNEKIYEAFESKKQALTTPAEIYALAEQDKLSASSGNMFYLLGKHSMDSKFQKVWVVNLFLANEAWVVTMCEPKQPHRWGAGHNLFIPNRQLVV